MEQPCATGAKLIAPARFHVTPVMAAGVMDQLFDVADLVALLIESEAKTAASVKAVNATVTVDRARRTLRRRATMARRTVYSARHRIVRGKPPRGIP